jgi:polyisoprenoid-binding protein YceI
MVIDSADRTGRWVLDPAQSTVTFTHKTMWGLVTVRGRFTDLSGEGVVDPDGSLRGVLKLEAVSVDTKNAKRDKHLRSADFFNVDAHEQISYAVSQADQQPDGSLVLTGELGVVGNVRPLQVTADLSDASASSATLSTELVIDRSDFGVDWNRGGMLKGLTTVKAVAHFSKVAG